VKIFIDIVANDNETIPIIRLSFYIVIYIP